MFFLLMNKKVHTILHIEKMIIYANNNTWISDESCFPFFVLPEKITTIKCLEIY